MKISYYLLLAFFALLVLFMTGVPDLRRCPLPSQADCDRRIGKKDILLIALVCILYGGVAFSALGNTDSPQSFAPMWEEPVIIELDEPVAASELLLFCGVGEGQYRLEYSMNGFAWAELGSFQHSYTGIFKWHSMDISAAPEFSYLRISAWGNVYLGELAIIDRDGSMLPYRCTLSALCDEQELVCREENFLNSTYFDEIYHARTAWEHLNGIYPYEVSHPPLGKLIISLGMLLFGTTPFGWRFMGTLFGVFMLPVIYAFAKRLFGGRAVPLAAAIVLATDFMHFVQTRIATIDTYGVFFILLMYLFMYRFVSNEEDDPCSPAALRELALSGLFFGLGVASKWTAIYAGAGLAIIWAAYWLVKRGKGLGAFMRNVAFCVLFFVLVPALIYYVSYFAYGKAAGLEGPGMFFSGEYARIVWENQKFMFSYHSGLVSEHPYSSRWYQWILNIRPILYYLQYFDGGLRSSFGAYVNPALCWGGLLCLPVLVYMGIFRRDHQALFILTGYLAQLVPWIFISRLTFEYHYFPCTVFLVLALAYVFKLIRLGNPSWKIYVGGFVSLSLLLFVMFYPTVSGMIVDNAKATQYLGWLPTWPF